MPPHPLQVSVLHPTFPISTGIVKNLLKTTRNNVLYVIVKNQDLLKNKEQMEY